MGSLQKSERGSSGARSLGTQQRHCTGSLVSDEFLVAYWVVSDGDLVYTG